MFVYKGFLNCSAKVDELNAKRRSKTAVNLNLLIIILI
tara:strand:+ start:190 stop:303 length:114 start_codon:yes stop_codon:yes gene_type:complete